MKQYTLSQKVLEKTLYHNSEEYFSTVLFSMNGEKFFYIKKTITWRLYKLMSVSWVIDTGIASRGVAEPKDNPTEVCP